MSRLDEVRERRRLEAERIRKSYTDMAEKSVEAVQKGEEFVAFVHLDKCIGCDQCLLVCDDKAIEMYDEPLRNPNLESENNKKAKILRDDCTGCRLCVLACPTDAIVMIER